MQLRKLYEKLDVLEQLESVEFDGSVLVVEHAQKSIVINKHEPSQQIWYSSFTGVDYFAESQGKWESTRNEASDISSRVDNDIQQLLLQETGK